MNVLSQLRPRRPRGSFSRGALMIIAGTGAGQALTILSSPVLTRIFAPADLGAYGVAVSLLAILITVTCLAYDFAVPIPRDDVGATNVVALCIVLAIVIGLGIGVVLAIGGADLMTAMGARGLEPYVGLIALGTLTGGLNMAFHAFTIRLRRYRELAANRVLHSAVTVAGQIGLGLAGFGAPALLIGAVLANIVGTARLAWVSLRAQPEAFAAVTLAGMRAAASRFRRFPLLSAPSNLINTLALQLPVLMIVALYGVAVGGQYVLAQRVIALPAALVANSVGRAFLAEAALIARTEPSRLAGMFRHTTRVLAVGALPPVALVAIAAPFVFPFVFGGDWVDAGLHAAILAPMYYLQFVTNPTAPTLDVLERQDLFLIREVLRLAVLGAVFIVASAAGLPSLVTVGLISLSGSLAYALNGLLAAHAIRVHARTHGTAA